MGRENSSIVARKAGWGLNGENETRAFHLAGGDLRGGGGGLPDSNPVSRFESSTSPRVVWPPLTNCLAGILIFQKKISVLGISRWRDGGWGGWGETRHLGSGVSSVGEQNEKLRGIKRPIRFRYKRRENEAH